MSSLTPHEYASKVLIPSLRALVAWKLYEKGHGQYGIARLLGVSQPMVHRYLSKDATYYADRLAAEVGDENLVEDAVERAAALLEAGNRPGFWRLINELTIHSRFCRGREDECRAALCSSGEELYISAYKTVLAKLLSIPCLSGVIPEVGSNLAYTPQPGLPRERIVALDGRIVRSADGAAIAAGSPKPGGSRHTARVLSMYSGLDSRLRWAVALRHTALVVEALREMSVPLAELGSQPSAEGPRGLLAVVEPPGPGREGVVYLLSPTAEDLLRAVAAIASRICNS